MVSYVEYPYGVVPLSQMVYHFLTYILKVKVGGLCFAQQPGSYWDRSPTIFHLEWNPHRGDNQ